MMQLPIATAESALTPMAFDAYQQHALALENFLAVAPEPICVRFKNIVFAGVAYNLFQIGPTCVHGRLGVRSRWFFLHH
jgi:hypothetical protein